MVPFGVNLGGWFCLEDWFYSDATGPHAGHCVKTPEPGVDAPSHRIKGEDYVGCVRSILPLTRDEEERLERHRFACESDLVNLLLRSNFSKARVVELFKQHRRRYITPIDFARLRALGIRHVRLPITWCITYDTSYVIRGRTFDGKDASIEVQPGAGLVEDPFTNEAAFDPKRMASAPDRWVALPSHVLERILETAAAFGIKVLLDVHAFPGGAAAGTFNGIWPLNPRFWSAHHAENFRTITCRLLDWMVSLQHSKPRAFRALYGLSPMNEPAHLRGLFDPTGLNVASIYDLGKQRIWAAEISVREVLETLAISVVEFRNRAALVQSGKTLVMNVIETAFNGCFGKADKNAFGASQQGEIGDVYSIIGTWWRSATTPEERESWAILDIHNYISWNPRNSQFREMKTFNEYQQLIKDMSLPFFLLLRQRVGMPAPQKLACSEYSASTDQETFASVTSGVGPRPPQYLGFDWQHVRDWFLMAQNRAAKDEGITMWFWTYHIRRNVNYQGEWSLQHVLSPWPRLRRCLPQLLADSGPPRLDVIGNIMVESTHSVCHLLSVAFFMLLRAARSPVRGLWTEALGFRFGFRY